jgi:hypothetical protein
MPKSPSGLLSMAKIIIFYSWPPTFDAESKRLNTKRIAPNLYMEIWAWFRAIVLLSVSYSQYQK